MLKRKDIELMAPAGSYESLMAAIKSGADSVYFGAGKLNMRASSSVNFSLNDLVKIANICQKYNVKSYLTVNTVIYDDEIEIAKKIAKTAKDSGITAIIASDMSVIKYCNEINMECHASTQLNISNTEAVKFFSNYCNVIVLARELSLDKVKTIYNNIQNQQIRAKNGELIKIEMFVHGALCMSISGKCYLSLHEFNRSANRGDCLQNCRRKYEVKDKETGNILEIDNEYIMSPKDLCTITFLDKIIDAGARVLKIEGRGRSPEYVKIVVENYNKAIDLIINNEYNSEKASELENNLKTVFNRGFWGGYYLGKKLGEWTNRYGSSATKKKDYVGKITHYYSKLKVAVALVESQPINSDDEIIIIGETTGAYIDKLNEIRLDDKPIKQAKKGDLISFKVNSIVRPNDKLYKWINANRQPI